MNENCKYCKTAKTCLENADYNSIYCQIHKRIPKVIDKTYDELLKENKQLKENLEEQEQEYNRMFGLWDNRKYIKKFNKEYDEEDKKNTPDRDYASVYPDAEEIYKRYYCLKEKLELVEKANKEAIEYIKEKPLYYERYDYNYDDELELVEISSEQAEYDLLEILDTDKGGMKDE